MGLGATACSHLAPYVQGPLPTPSTADPQVSVTHPPIRTAIAEEPRQDGEKETDLRGTVVLWSTLSDPGSGFFLQVATDAGPVSVRVVLFQNVSWALSPGTPIHVRFREDRDVLILSLTDPRGPLFFLIQGPPSLGTPAYAPPIQVRPRSTQAWVQVWEDESLCRIVTSHREGEAITPEGRIVPLRPGLPQDLRDEPVPARVLLTMNRTDLENSCGRSLSSRFGWWWMRL